MSAVNSPDDILKFWFEELSPDDWYTADAALDATIRDRFCDIHERAAACELYSWRTNVDVALAEIIILDQFSRNIYRNTPRAFAQDNLALALAQEAIAKGFDKKLEPQRICFLYLPFMHSESRVIHERAVELYRGLGDANNIGYERQHKAIIDMFGRYPHRNNILGRKSTPQEEEFLKQPNSSF